MKRRLSSAAFLIVPIVLASHVEGQPNVKLRPETSRAFDAYARTVEQQMEDQLDGNAPLKWIDITDSQRSAIVAGKIVTERVNTDDLDVPNGIIHDWLGVMFVPGVTAGSIMAMLQDIDHHAEYFSEVLQSRLLRRDGDTIRSFLRLRKEKILTVVLDTEYETRYVEFGDGYWYLRSRSTRIAQVENPGAADEKVLPVGEGSGFLWRLNVYWRLSETSGGTWVEIRTLSLSRQIPFLLAPLIRPFVSSVPKESLEATLRGTRDAVVP